MNLSKAVEGKVDKSVIYLITNTVNDKGYIGSTNVFYRRIRQHLRDLRLGAHHSAHLQGAWNKYGESRFKVEIVEYCPVYKLIEREQSWLDRTEFWDRSKGYNVRRIADRPNEMTEDERVAHGKKVKARMRRDARVKVILNPEGVEIEFGLITDLCAEYGLCATSIGNVMNDRARQYKGWMLPLYAREARFHHTGSEWTFINPDGIVVKIHNMTAFCKGEGLCQNAMRLVATGKQGEHRGYRSIEPVESKRVPMRKFKLRAPNGTIIDCEGIKATARLIGADKNGVKRLISGKQATCKGYTIYSD